MKKNILIFVLDIFYLSCLSQEIGAFTDNRDGKIYKTVKIGTQTWMAENLAYDADTGYWSYNNDENNISKYGYLYNLETAKMVCPEGWHLPSDIEWDILSEYLGGRDISGGKLKESGTCFWINQNLNTTNSCGFEALPGGYRANYNGKFFGLRFSAYWWSDTESYANNAWYREIYVGGNYLGRSIANKSLGFSVRCLKN